MIETCADRVAWSEQFVANVEGFTPDEKAKWDAHPKHDKFIVEFIRAKCLTDLWWHMKYGCYFQRMMHYHEPLHGPDGVAGWQTNWYREEYGQQLPIRIKFLIMARELCKTQQGLAYDSWEFARDVNHRLLIRAFVEPKASEILVGLREILDSELFQKMYPWVRSKKKKNSKQDELWSASQLKLAREDIGIRSPSVEACGIRSDPTGGHFSIGHYDDFEVRENANSELLMAETLAVWQADDNLFTAGARRTVYCTPWGKDGIVNSVLNHRNTFKDHKYDLFVQPATVKIFDQTFDGHEPVLLEDRVTFRCSPGIFPQSDTALQHCQAKITLFSPEIKDTIVEVREVEWNDSMHFRVNRPIPKIFGQPLTFHIGNEKPSSPNRHTMDAVDWIPNLKERKTFIARKSLPQARQDQGSFMYNAQMNLRCVDTESLVFNSADIKIVKRCDLPEGPRRYFRACDFASSKKTLASTAIITAFYHADGIFIEHLFYENRAKPSAILLELFMGIMRVRAWEWEIECTYYEKASIESTLGDFLPQAMQNPLSFFTGLGGKCEGFAKATFSEGDEMFFTRRALSRGHYASKPLRIASSQPYVESGRLHIVADCPNRDVIIDQADSFKLASKFPYDIWDAIADIISEGRPPVVPKEDERGPGLYAQINREAIMNTTMRTLAEGTGWPPE